MAGFFRQMFGKGDVNSDEPVKGSFSFGVTGVPKTFNADELVVEGKVDGTVKPGMVVNISNYGDDNRRDYVATIIDIEVKQKQVAKATDCTVSLRINNPGNTNIKAGTLFFTDDSTQEELHDSYVDALEEYYINMHKLDFTQGEIDIMSISDLAEVIRLISKRFEPTDVSAKRAIDKLKGILCARILEADEIYAVIDKTTGEPHMYSELYKRETGTLDCTPPCILLITKAYFKLYESKYQTPIYEIFKISKEENPDEIIDFLGTTFYLNGAEGVHVLFKEAMIPAEKLVPKPDFSQIPENERPITNPELVKWMLLVGQLDTAIPENAEAIKFFTKNMQRAALNAKLIIPIKAGSPSPSTSEDGRIILTQSTKDSLATAIGKYIKDSVRIYTDWKRLLMEYDSGWGGFVQTVPALIHEYDCAINVTRYMNTSLYIDENLYDQILDEVVGI
jgi:hypothetical protein